MEPEKNDRINPNTPKPELPVSNDGPNSEITDDLFVPKVDTTTPEKVIPPVKPPVITPPLPTIKALLKQILKYEEIIKVVFVDEQVAAPDLDKLKSIINTNWSEKEEEIKKISVNGVNLNQEQPIIGSYLDTNWAKLDTAKQDELYKKVLAIVDKEYLEDYQVKIDLEDYFDNLVPLTPDKWDSYYKALVPTLGANQKILVLFDQELGPEFAKKGHELIAEAKAGNVLGLKIIPILFTNTIENLEDEIAKRNEIITTGTTNLEKVDFFALSKARRRDEKLFADGIKKSLLNTYCEKLKTESIAVMKDAFEKTIEDIEKWDTYDFDYAVFQSSYKEGAWAPSTLQRIAKIQLEDNLLTTMSGTDYLKVVNPLVAKAQKFVKPKIDIENTENPYGNRYKLRCSELYMDQEHLNKLNLPVENGDIFEIVTGQSAGLYILVNQGCDLMVRYNGKRSSSIGTLLKIEMMDEELVTKEINEKLTAKDFRYSFWDFNFELPHYNLEESKFGVVKFSAANRLMVDLDILDLSVYHPDGHSDWDPGVVELDLTHFSYSWGKRHSKIKEKFDGISKTIDSIMSEVSHFSVDKQQLLLEAISVKLSFLKHAGIDLAYDDKTKKFSFGIKRVRRLRQIRAEYLLEKFNLYLSRKGFDHDFADMDR